MRENPYLKKTDPNPEKKQDSFPKKTGSECVKKSGSHKKPEQTKNRIRNESEFGYLKEKPGPATPWLKAAPAQPDGY